MAIETFYSENVTRYTAEESKWERMSFRYSVIRIILFVVSLFLFVFFANAREPLNMGIIVVSFPLVFGYLVSRHNKIIKSKELAGNLREINEEEIRRTNHDFSGLKNGEQYLSRDHAYAYDLDIFGQNSLFQLLNRTSTPSGELRLVSWLLNPGEVSELRQRHEALSELTSDIPWNQEFQASGRMISKGTDQSRLLSWLQKPADIPARPYSIAGYVLPLLLLITIVLTIAGTISIYIPLILLFINGAILKKFQKRLLSVTTYTSGNARLLASYAALISMIEQRSFNAPLLVSLKEPFQHEGSTATKKITSLRKLADFLDGRGNMFYQFLNIFFLLDIFLIHAAESWKVKNKEDIEHWFTNIGEFEALISLAGFQISHPTYVTPAFSSGEVFKVEGMAHPLIHPSERVANDFHMAGKGTVNIITGSNMSGKSTFLRTVGVNAVLAYTGAVICARSMELSIFRVYTGMRTEDNLEEHISSFYAELRRIKRLLEYIDEVGPPVLYMLDEILKGTNTHDRHKGSASLVKKLSASPALGFVSTHDLELGTLSEENDRIVNYSFNSQIKDDEIIFDYTIAEGVCHSFNASMLMKKIGILED
jgi:hypothetical protein